MAHSSPSHICTGFSWLRIGAGRIEVMKLSGLGKAAFGAALSVTLILGASPSYAEEIAGEAPPAEVTVDQPDQPEWGAQWRDREVTVSCNPDGTNSRIVVQSMWRPSEPALVDGVWVTYDDWHEWGWPEVAQTVYKPVEPGECPAIDMSEEPVEETPATEEATHPELAKTGGQELLWPAAAAGAALIAGGIILMRRAVRK